MHGRLRRNPQLAAEANLKHGVPLNRGETRKLLSAYVKAGRHRLGKRRVKSSRDIAKDLHGLASHATILKWMKSDFPSVYRQMTDRRPEGTGEGGLPEVDQEEVRHQAALSAIDRLKAESRGIEDQARRGEVIAYLRTALEDIEQALPWEPLAPAEALETDGF